MPRHQSTISPSIRNIVSKPSPANLDQFDPWNSSSTGHQRSENPYSGTGWRETRMQKLSMQLGKGDSSCGAGRGEWKWVTPGEREEEEEEKRKADRSGDIRSFFGVKKKKMLVDNGANISIYLGRRTVTHVILGRPNSPKLKESGTIGAGGGLALGKLQREIQRVGGQGVKFVGVEWVLESIKTGRRLPEARFATLHMASGKQRSVLADFGV
ncbi:predicted protein [Uncinocarpus reesii 1704]|uniref:BRCT domain-containing protein n=1 Tax=Uncinocarpus reesii (strain UAMH 1704) TaxID=336963 RepID=C4JEV6_UNCRE|nr:uncharacterized protein UREG_00856 [Uncinocarpus reesii 1704]EEP76009.1 predicted protein [Uncinocarpus reesii 1704]